MPETPEALDPAFEAAMREAFLVVPLHQQLDLQVVDVGHAGTAAMAVPIRDNALGNTGQLHGGAIALLFDLVCAAAATTSGTYDPMTQALVTADLHVRYLGAAKGTLATARADVVKAGRTLIVVEATMIDELGNLIARADFSATVVSPRPRLD
jgi:acyl-CoA thioesterase